MNTSLYDFWETAHKKMDIVYLTGCCESVEGHLFIQELLPKAKQLLNIGIGLGLFER